MWPLALHRFAPLYIEFHSLGKRNLHCNGHDMNRSIWNSWLEGQRLRGGAREYQYRVNSLTHVTCY